MPVLFITIHLQSNIVNNIFCQVGLLDFQISDKNKQKSRYASLIIFSFIFFNMSEVQIKIKQIGNKYEQLKKTENTAQKDSLCVQIVRLCVQTEKILEKAGNPQQRFKLGKQVSSIKTKVLEISDKLRKDKLSKKSSSCSSEGEQVKILEIRNSQDEKLTEEQMQKKLVRTILFQELTSKQMSASAEEIQKIAIKMQQNLSVMEEIKKIIQDQGNDLDAAEQNIVTAYETTVEANKDLEEAAQMQLRTRLLKIRAGITGILASIGFFFMGLPGALLGLVGALKLGRSKIKN